jgi:hypothetical protein
MNILVELWDFANCDQSKAGAPMCARLHKAHPSAEPRGETDMAKGEQRSNREAKKPKKEKIKVIAAAPSQKTGGWQPTLNTGKKK